MTHTSLIPTPLSPQQAQALGKVSEFYSVPQLAPEAGEILRFGLIADPQYADSDTVNNRFYRQSLDKLSSAIAQLNTQPLSFVVTLGDLVDQHWQSFAPVLSRYSALHHPHAAVIGNHDAAVISSHLAASQLPLPTHYYAFTLPGYRFVVIDGNDVSLYCNQANGVKRSEAERVLAELEAEQQLHAQPWNGALGQSQLMWLEQQLIEARKKEESVIVFGHYPVTPANKHNLWNCELLVSLLCRYQVRAYFAGHDHLGGYQRVERTDFITLQGMVEGSDPYVSFAVVEVHSGRLNITGFGNEPSRKL